MIGAAVAGEHGPFGQVGGEPTDVVIDACIRVLSRMLEQLADAEVD